MLTIRGPEIDRRQLFLLLLTGAICIVFSQGRWPIPIVAFLGYILLLRFMRSFQHWSWFIAFTIAFTAAIDLAFTGTMPFPIIPRLSIFFGTALVFGLVFLVDRWVSRRSDALWTTLTFPAVMRAIEQGFSLVRPTGNGFSFVSDPMGRMLAWQNTDRPGEHVMVADVPTQRRNTIYSVIGDVFAWLCLGVFAIILGFNIYASRANKHPSQQTGH